VQIGSDDFGVVVQHDDDADAAELDENLPRPAIGSIMVRTAGNEAEALVTVSATGGLLFDGRAVGPSGAAHRYGLVAQATLNALEELLGSTAAVESAQVVPAGSREVALTVLSVSIPRLGEQLLTGSAMVRGDESEAVARSVLDALNRRLTG
jgi:hypothetical protein